MGRIASSQCLFLASVLGAALHAVAQEVPARSLAAMASEEFKERESGQSELLDWAREHQAVALDAIWKQFRSSPDPEVQQRCLAVLRELVKDQYMTEGPGFLGIGLSYGKVAPPGEIALAHAVLVTMVRRETPASRAGIQAGDMIVMVDGKGWSNELSPSEFSDQIAARKPGAKVSLKIVRDGKWVEVDAVLVRRPPNLQLLRFGIGGVDEAAEEQAAIETYFKEWLNERILLK